MVNFVNSNACTSQQETFATSETAMCSVQQLVSLSCMNAHTHTHKHTDSHTQMSQNVQLWRKATFAEVDPLIAGSALFLEELG